VNVAGRTIIGGGGGAVLQPAIARMEQQASAFTAVRLRNMSSELPEMVWKVDETGAASRWFRL
jgi:hypothetical protein